MVKHKPGGVAGKKAGSLIDEMANPHASTNVAKKAKPVKKQSRGK